MPCVVIITTMWGKVETVEGIQREDELKEGFWKEMLAHGCRTAHFYKTHRSAWDIIGSITQEGSGATLRIQKEIVNAGKSLSQTKAAAHANKKTSKVSRGLMGMFRKLFS